MTCYAILRTAKLKALGNVAASLAHTFRDRDTPNADPARIRSNQASDGRNAGEVLAAISARLPAKRRRDAVLCIEYLVAASPEFFQGGETGAAYFRAAREWLAKRHGAENIAFWAVHRDETSPHLVAYVVPLREGRLNTKHWLGGREKLRQMQSEFAQEVGQRFGLRRGIEGSRATHTTVREFYTAAGMPAPAVPVVELAPPPLLGREAWAKGEAERISKTLRPVLDQAAKADRWGQLQAKGKREALATAQHLEKRAKAAEAEAARLRQTNREAVATTSEWHATYEAGLTPEQVETLHKIVEHLRSQNRTAPVEHEQPMAGPGMAG